MVESLWFEFLARLADCYAILANLRNCPGMTPMRQLKSRVIWLWSEKPRCAAPTASDRLVPARGRRLGRSTRREMTYWWGGSPLTPHQEGEGRVGPGGHIVKRRLLFAAISGRLARLEVDRARRSDDTEARNDFVSCFGRSDRSAQRLRWLLRSIRPKRAKRPFKASVDQTDGRSRAFV
jgi:hypothetical protein